MLFSIKTDNNQKYLGHKEISQIEYIGLLISPDQGQTSNSVFPVSLAQLSTNCRL